MKEISLEILNREKTGKSFSKSLRNEGRIPAIVYGNKKEPAYISIQYAQIIKEIEKTGFFSTIFNLKINKKSVKVLPREVQTDSLNDKPIHIDFLRMFYPSYDHKKHVFLWFWDMTDDPSK